MGLMEIHKQKGLCFWHMFEVAQDSSNLFFFLNCGWGTMEEVSPLGPQRSYVLGVPHPPALWGLQRHLLVPLRSLGGLTAWTRLQREMLAAFCGISGMLVSH